LDNIDFEQRVRGVSRQLSKLCCRLYICRMDAEDLYQTTLLTAFRFFDKYDREKPFDRWVYSICLNTYRNQYKKQKKYSEAAFSSTEEKNAFIETIAARCDEYNEESEIRQIVDSLDVKKKAVIILYYFEDLKIGDIAKILKIHEGTVKKRLFDARRIIRERMQGNYE